MHSAERQIPILATTTKKRLFNNTGKLTIHRDDPNFCTIDSACQIQDI